MIEDYYENLIWKQLKLKEMEMTKNFDEFWGRQGSKQNIYNQKDWAKIIWDAALESRENIPLDTVVAQKIANTDGTDFGDVMDILINILMNAMNRENRNEKGNNDSLFTLEEMRYVSRLSGIYLPRSSECNYHKILNNFSA